MTIFNAVVGHGDKAKLIGLTTVPTAFPQTYSPPTGYDGLSYVTLYVPENLVPSNIRIGVDIAGVTGIYEGEATETKLPDLVSGITVNLTAQELEGCTNVREYGFYKAELGIVELPDTCTAINAYGFCDSTVKEVVGKGVSYIGSYALARTNITSFDASNATISTSSFQGCQYLSDIKLSDSLTYIPVSCFYQCPSLTDIEIPSSCLRLGESCFNSTGMTTIDLPEGLTTIETTVFKSSKLQTIEIPSTVKKMGNYVFERSSIKQLKMRNDTPCTIGSSIFRYCSSLEKILVPAGSLDAYKSATNWSAYADYMEEYE